MFPCNDSEKQEFEDKWQRKKNDLRSREEELKEYEEKVFIEHIVESENITNRKQFARDYEETRNRY